MYIIYYTIPSHINGGIDKLYKIVYIVLPNMYFEDDVRNISFLSHCLIFSNIMRCGFLFAFDIVSYLLPCSGFLVLM